MKKRKKLVISGLIIVAVIAGGIFLYFKVLKNKISAANFSSDVKEALEMNTREFNMIPYEKKDKILAELQAEGKTLKYNLDGSMEISTPEENKKYVKEKVLTQDRNKIDDYARNLPKLPPELKEFEYKFYPAGIN